MISLGLNTEHHAIPDRYVCFIYNQGGALVKWYRDTFASVEHHQAEAEGRSIYPTLFEEIPAEPSVHSGVATFCTHRHIQGLFWIQQDCSPGYTWERGVVKS